MQKENEVEAEQIEDGTVEKGQDHDPGVNKKYVHDCHSTGRERA